LLELKRKGGDFSNANPFTSVMMLANAISWVAYAYNQDDLYLFFANSPGVVLSILSAMLLLRCYDAENDDKAMLMLKYVAGLFTALLIIHFLCIFFLQDDTETILGTVCLVTTCSMYASPLATVKTVIQTRDSSSIFLKVTMAQIFASAMWTVYGFAVDDYVIYGPNLFGLLLGLIQLVVKKLIPSSSSSSGSNRKDGYQTINP